MKNLELHCLFTTRRTRWPLLCLLSAQQLPVFQSGLVRQYKHSINLTENLNLVLGLAPMTLVTANNPPKQTVPLPSRNWRGCFYLLRRLPYPSSGAISCSKMKSEPHLLGWKKSTPEKKVYSEPRCTHVPFLACFWEVLMNNIPTLHQLKPMVSQELKA